MKNILLRFTVLFFLSSLALKAQPVFTNAYDFQVGQSITLKVFNQHTLSPGPEGPNQTWSFTNAPAGNTFAASIIAPAGTPAAAEFPLANKVFRFAGDTADIFQYYLAGSQQTENLGSATIYNIPEAPPNMVIKFTDTRITGKYPLNIGQSFTDTYAYTLPQVVDGQVFSTTFSNGKSTMKYDAYGTVSTPAGTFNNCIRMKMTSSNTDSTVYPSLPIPGTVNKSRSTTYLWFHQAGTSFPVVFQLSRDTSINFSGVQVTSSSGYYSQSLTRIHPKESDGLTRIFPNPASDFISVPGLNSGQIRLIASDGREWHCTIAEGKADLRNIPSGIYHVIPGLSGASPGRLIKK